MLKSIYKKYGFFILIAYLIAAYFYMPLGMIAIICMMAPIIFALMGKKRYWCGNFCPRGIFFQNVTGRFSRRKPIPNFLKSVGFRIFIVCFIILLLVKRIVNSAAKIEIPLIPRVVIDR